MIIEKIYIENFGKLSNFTIELKDGLNCVFGNNEDGKTTVMSFIRLMFYGNCGKKSDICSNIRHRFRPLSGAEMGGSIDFSHAGKSYTLIKTFGKSTRGDKVVLLDRAYGTKLPISSDKELGEEFFLMGADAFERSIYIGSLPITGDDGYSELSSKLAASVYTGDTGDSFEQLDERLQNALGNMKTPRKVGITDKLEREIEELDRRLSNANFHEKERLAAEDEAKALEKSLEEKRDLLQKATAAAQKQALSREVENRKKYNSLLAECGSLTPEKVSKAETLLNDYRILNAELNARKDTLPAEETADIQSAETALITATDKLENINRELEEKEALFSQYEKKENAAKGINPLLFFLLAGLFFVSAFSGYFASPLFLLLLAPATCCLVCAIIFLSKNNGLLKEKEDILTLKQEALTLKQQQSDLSSQVTLYSERLRILKENAQKAEAQKEALKSEQAEKRALAEQKRVELYSILNNPDDAEAALKAAKEALSSLNAIGLLLSQSPYKDISDDELEKKLSLCGDDTCSFLSVDELTRETEHLNGELIRKKSELKTAFSRFESPAVLEREIKEKRALLEKQNAYCESISLAREVLSEAYYEMRQNFAPELNRLAAEYLSVMTDGKYTGATISNEFSVLVNQNGAMPIESEYLSSGSRDQLDLCVRLALARLTSGQNRLPLMLDDILIQYDAKRASAAFSLIAKYAADTQVLFFTCHKHIEALAKENDANLLSL